MHLRSTFSRVACFAIAIILLISCNKFDFFHKDNPKKIDQVFYVLTPENRIVKYNAENLKSELASVN